MASWPGRHLLEGSEHRRYFGLKMVVRGVVEFECRNEREYDMWTVGVERLLPIGSPGLDSEKSRTIITLTVVGL